MQSPPSLVTAKQQVVILGGGYAGCHTAKLLDELNTSKQFEITLVSPREGFLLHKIGALRAAVLGSSTAAVCIPTHHLFAKNQTGTIATARAVGVDPDERTVTLQDGDVLKWDVLVVATGSRANCPGEPPVVDGANTESVGAVGEYFARFRRDLVDAKSVLIVGTGPVALELAGEIRAHAATVGIQCVGRTGEILDRAQPSLRAAGVKSVKRLVKQLGIELFLQDEYVVAPQKEAETMTWFKPEHGSVELKSGRRVNCDLVVFATGVTVNTAFLPSAWLDAETREVVIDKDTLRVRGRYDVFAIGDCAQTGVTKLAYTAMEDSKPLARNILLALEKRAPQHRVTRYGTGMMFITMGPNKGRGLLPFTTLGNWLTSQIKSRDLFTKKQWKELNAGTPPPTQA